MRLNNKGFAITGVLYTVLILFSLILTSILIGLNSRRNIMDKSTETVMDDFSSSTLMEEDKIPDGCDTTACVTGKYVFATSDNKYCSIYLQKGATIPTIINTTTMICDSGASGTITLDSIYEFK